MSNRPPLLLPDHPMFTDAVDAMRRYDEAKADGASPEEIERLRLIAESQFQAITDYQLKALGGPAGPVH
ncbi:hypothetical protein [Pseudomonas sp.]|uniref:hypothetical protein n=1 Tax=Pseudomonas sp. TaxID=306 RepID=UPI003C7209A2